MLLHQEPELSSCISAQKGHDPQLSLALGMVAKARSQAGELPKVVLR